MLTKGEAYRFAVSQDTLLQNDWSTIKIFNKFAAQIAQ